MTDEGLMHFEKKTLPLTSLFVNGLTGITSVGLNILIGSCFDTLVELEAALMEQSDMKIDFFNNLAKCHNLEFLDLTGDTNVDDMGFSILAKYEITVSPTEKHRPGMRFLHTLRLNGCSLSDMTIVDLIKVTTSIEHLEMAGCDRVTEFGINKLLECCAEIKFLDMNAIPAITYAFLDDIMQRKPQILIKRHKYQDVDFKKDNGLRVPRPIASKKKKKKGKKKKGKKKK